jgi:hypothetical protein
MSAKDLIQIDYSGPGTAVIPLGLGDAAEVRRVKSGGRFELSASAWEAAQKLPNVRHLVAAEQLRASRPV